MAVHFQVHSRLLLAISMLALKGSNSVIKKKKKKRLFWIISTIFSIKVWLGNLL